MALLRGAIFFVGMSLWGNQRISTLETYSPMTILPTFRQASLVCTHHLVVYEITLQTERLVNKASSTNISRSSFGIALTPCQEWSRSHAFYFMA